MRLPRALGLRGLTLVELMVTVGIFALVGLMVFLILNTGMVLYAKTLRSIPLTSRRAPA